MPLLFSLDSRVPDRSEGRRALGELLFAFLDNVHVVGPERIRELYNLLGEKLSLEGVRLHGGKTRTWNKGATRPPRMDDLGPDVWNSE